MENRTANDLADWQGYLTHAEIDGLKQWAARLMPSAVIVKIGAGAGTDTLAILEKRQDVVIFSIDIECCRKPETVNEHLRIEETDWKDTGHLIRIWGDSVIVGKRWPFPVDMVFVDGCHEEECKRADIETWLPHVVHGGVIAFHDYGSDKWPGVKNAVDDLIGDDYDQIMFIDTLIAFRVYDDSFSDLFTDYVELGMAATP